MTIEQKLMIVNVANPKNVLLAKPQLSSKLHKVELQIWQYEYEYHTNIKMI